MKRLLSFPAWGVLILVASLSEAQTAEPQSPVNKSAGTSRIVALNTNEIEGLPIDSGKLKFIASNEDTNGAFSIVERTQDPCYKTTWHRHDGYEESSMCSRACGRFKSPTSSLNSRPVRTC